MLIEAGSNWTARGFLWKPEFGSAGAADRAMPQVDRGMSERGTPFGQSNMARIRKMLSELQLLETIFLSSLHKSNAKMTEKTMSFMYICRTTGGSL